MNVSIAGRATRFRQLPPLARPAIKVVNWQPAARLMVAGLAFVTIGSQAGVQLRLSIAAAGVAASSAFLLDDHAAVTLASSPTSLPIRRLHRVTVAALAVGLWWVAAVSVATNRAGSFPVAGRALELSVLVAIALAASAVASTVGDRTTGGIAGAACSIAVLRHDLPPPAAVAPTPRTSRRPRRHTATARNSRLRDGRPRVHLARAMGTSSSADGLRLARPLVLERKPMMPASRHSWVPDVDLRVGSERVSGR